MPVYADALVSEKKYCVTNCLSEVKVQGKGQDATWWYVIMA